MFHKAKFPCDQCGKVNERIIKPIDPYDFTDRKKATMLTQYWCVHCQSPQAFRLQFTRDIKKNIKVKVKHRVKTSSLLLPKVPVGITIRPKQKSYKG